MKVTIVIESGGTKVSFEMDGLELESAYTSIAQMLGIDPVQAWSYLRSATDVPPKPKPTAAVVEKVSAKKMPGKSKMTPAAKRKSIKHGPSVPTAVGPKRVYQVVGLKERARLLRRATKLRITGTHGMKNAEIRKAIAEAKAKAKASAQ